MITTVCFDYYNTLVKIGQPFRAIRTWISEYLETHDYAVNPITFFNRFQRYRASLTTEPVFRLGIDILRESLRKTCLFYKVSDFAGEFSQFIEALFSITEPFADAFTTLSDLRSRYEVGLITNADNYILQRSIWQNGFSFGFIVTSEDARSYKPDKDIFRFTLEKLDRKPEEVIMIGDSQIDDVTGANQLTIRSIWINRDREPLKEGIAKPDYTIDRLSEIPGIINQINTEQ